MIKEIGQIGDCEYSAGFSDDRRFRYWLGRRWDKTLPIVCWIMLNPSTADAKQNDNTITRCMRYARAWGYGGIEVRNLYSYRATDPKELFREGNHGEIIGYREGREALQRLPGGKAIIVAAWGSDGGRDQRGQLLLDSYLKSRPVWCLALTAGGQPRHPLYLRKDLKPMPLNEQARLIPKSQWPGRGKP